MDQKIVVGVGNIYAIEVLFSAGNVSLTRYKMLLGALKLILTEAIKQGGTTLKDFVAGDGKPGYFQQMLHI